MAKFFINGMPPKQTKSFVAQDLALKVNRTTDDTGIPRYTHKAPLVSTYMAVDPRIARLYKTTSKSISQPISIGFDSTMTKYNGQKAEIGLDLDSIVNYFSNKDATTSDNLVFGYPIKNENTVEISTSLMDAKFMTRKKNDSGEWATVINVKDNSVIFDSNEDKNEIKIFYMAFKVKGLPDTYMININGETMEIMEDLAITGSHTVDLLTDSFTYHGIAQQLIGPIFIGANEHGTGIVSCPKNAFKIRPFQTNVLKNIGIDTNAVALIIKTNLNWTKADNGDYEFNWKDSSDMSPKFLSIGLQQNDEIDFHDETRITMNYTVHRE